MTGTATTLRDWTLLEKKNLRNLRQFYYFKPLINHRNRRYISIKH